MLLDFLPLFLLMQGFCRAEIARTVDTSLPATSIGLYLKSLVRRELSFEHLQDLSNALGKTKDAEKPKDINEIVADAAKKLDFKMTLLQDFLTNMTNKLYGFYVCILCMYSICVVHVFYAFYLSIY